MWLSFLLVTRSASPVLHELLVRLNLAISIPQLCLVSIIALCSWSHQRRVVPAVGGFRWWLDRTSWVSFSDRSTRGFVVSHAQLLRTAPAPWKVNRGLRCPDLLIGWGSFFGGFFWKAERWSWGLSSIFSPCGSLSLSCGWTARFCSCRLLVFWWLRLFDWLVPWLLEFISASLPFLGWS